MKKTRKHVAKPEKPEKETVDPTVVEKRRRLHPAMIVLIVLLSVMIVALGAAFGYGYWLLRKISIANEYQVGEFDVNEWLQDENTVPDVELEEDDPYQDQVQIHGGQDGVYNIMVFGTDVRNLEDLTGGLTDVIMIVSLDQKDGQIRIASIMRDIMVKIPGTRSSYNRINTLNRRMGTEAAADAIAEMFGITIDHFAVMNFRSVSKIIDAAGGIELEITSREASHLNKLLSDEYKSMPELFGEDGIEYVPSEGGLLKLDGVQAMTYGRIRKIDSDFNRTERQRKVFSEVVKEVQDMSLTEMITLIPELSDFVRVDMTEMEIINYVRLFFEVRSGEIEQMRIPNDDTWSYTDNGEMIKVDFEENAALLREFLYGEE